MERVEVALQRRKSRNVRVGAVKETVADGIITLDEGKTPRLDPGIVRAVRLGAAEDCKRHCDVSDCIHRAG